MSKDIDVRTLSEKEKAAAYKVVGRQLAKLEEAHGESVVRWAVNRRHELRSERRRLAEEKKHLEARLAEIGAS